MEAMGANSSSGQVNAVVDDGARGGVISSEQVNSVVDVSEGVDRLGKLPLKEQQLSRTQHFILGSHAAMFVLQAQYGPWGIPLTPMIR